MKQIENELVSFVLKDFKERQEARRPLELNWRLNMNFVIGNQFAEISPRGDIEDRGKQYFWQSREVYNHISTHRRRKSTLTNFSLPPSALKKFSLPPKPTSQ